MELSTFLEQQSRVGDFIRVSSEILAHRYVWFRPEDH